MKMAFGGPIPPASSPLACLIALVDAGKISFRRFPRDCCRSSASAGCGSGKLAEENLLQQSDQNLLEPLIERVLKTRGQGGRI